MAIQTFKYKLSGSRKTEVFAVVPFETSATTIKFQSANRCIIAHLDTGIMFISPWIKRTPLYLDCQMRMGGTQHDINNDLREILESLTPKPHHHNMASTTSKSVTHHAVG